MAVGRDEKNVWKEGAGAEVLIVDDVAASVSLLDEMLSAAGYVVTAARDARAALRLARACPPDLILLDAGIAQTDVDGSELCRLSSDDPEGRNIPVIFLPASRDAGDMAQGFPPGVVDCIDRPFRAGEVLARVKAHVERRQLQTRLEACVEARTEQLRHSENELRLSRARLQEMTRFLQTVREDERTSIARELHDELGQTLTALRIDLGWIRGQCAGQDAACAGRADSAHALVERAIDALRRISEGLRPGMLGVLGLCVALEHQVVEFSERTGIACGFFADRDEYALESGCAIAVFRLVQEGLTNIFRHAGATQANVRLSGIDGWLELVIQDNGTGFDSRGPRKGFGLLGMRERVCMFGGEMRVESSGGTRITVRLPLVSGGAA